MTNYKLGVVSIIKSTLKQACVLIKHVGLHYFRRLVDKWAQ